MRKRTRNAVFSAAFLLAAAAAAQGDVFPKDTWEKCTPEEVGLDAAKLDEMSAFLQGRGCVVRHGYLAYTWGDYTAPEDIASAVKPWISHFLFKAVEQGRIPSVDAKVCEYAPCLNELNPALNYKDRDITFRHMANQISCYGVEETPGTAFDYNDFQMALFFDTLFLKVYGTTYENLDTGVLRPLLTDFLHCEDRPTFFAFGPEGKAGRLAVSPRDFARFGLLYLHEGNWRGWPLLTPSFARAAVTTPLPPTLPRTAGNAAQMCPEQRSIGSQRIPDNQCAHEGSYSWLWWINGVDQNGRRLWPSAPKDIFAALGHSNGMRGMAVFPSLDLILSWNDSVIGDMPEKPEPLDTAFRLASEAAGRRLAPGFVLGDQYNQVHSVAFPSGKVHLVMFADRHTGENVLKWYNPVAARYRGPAALESHAGEQYLAGVVSRQEQTAPEAPAEYLDPEMAALAQQRLDINGIVALEDIPVFWRPWVRWFFRRYAKTPVLLDHHDEVAKRYGFTPRKVNVFVVASDGYIVLKLEGKPTHEQLSALFSVVDRLLRFDAESGP